jgi:hypothetical protein
MLFILAMEPLQQMFSIASTDDFLSPLNCRAGALRVNLYVDHATVFIKPVKEEVSVVANILEVFGHVSGLVTNRGKCAVYPIHCDSLNLEDITKGFQRQVQNFPCTHLGTITN